MNRAEYSIGGTRTFRGGAYSPGDQFDISDWTNGPFFSTEEGARKWDEWNKSPTLGAEKGFIWFVSQRQHRARLAEQEVQRVITEASSREVERFISGLDLKL